MTHITVGTPDSLDEFHAIQVFKQLTKLQRFSLDMTSSKERATLVNALHEYEAAMASIDLLLTFKHLYTVLEPLTNIDGTNRDGSELDKQMAVAISKPQNVCKDWRELNNRTKHIHRTSEEVGTFVTGLGKLTEYIQ